MDRIGAPKANQTTSTTGGGERPRAAQAGTQEAAGANQPDDGFAGSQELDEEKKAEEARKDEKPKPEDEAKEDEIKRLEEKIKELEAELNEILKGNGDPFEALAVMNELNALNKQRENLTGQSTGQDLTPQNTGIDTGGGGAPPMGGGGAPPMGGGGAPPMGGGGAPPAGGGEGAPAPVGPAPEGQITPNGTGQDAVDLARQYVGRDSQSIRGSMPNFTAAGGQTNNCADFVSSALESTGRIRGHHINVREMERSLQAQGYVQVPASQARPGDVWISNSRGHTELVSTRGATHTIGSNNDRPGHQVISERPKPAGTGVIYQLRERP